MSKRKVLYVSHNHPVLHPGGAEAYALELYERMRSTDGWEPLFLARIGPNVAMDRTARPGTPFSSVGEDPNQYFLFTETQHFDFFKMTSTDKALYTRHLTAFLEAHRPDVVHFQHTQFIGVDMISLVRRVLPQAAIVYTLHEFLPICNNNGQLVRTMNGERCMESSPRRCHECFPHIAQEEFFLRKRFIQTHFDAVDLFTAPSRFLMQRYIDWGIARERIVFEDYGRRRRARVSEPSPSRAPNRIGFFGQISHFKGVNVLLRAMNLLAADGIEAHCWLHGANLELQPEPFKQEFGDLLATAEDSVTFVGRYDHKDLPSLMQDLDWIVVPSIWWENSPLVIQEAFLHGRPVICSDIGGMAEKVTHNVNGLHFRAGDPRSLAAALREAVTNPRLARRLRANAPPVFDIEEHITNLMRLYHQLGGQRSIEMSA
ncbi:MAG: glycosyl transferase [Solirubrobacterales bacterium]|nr:glycosyl transferase [Solirubrobacterales bacterium]